MAGMGQNGTINITPEMMDEAIKAITTYRTSAESLHSNIQTEVETLTASDFTGSASNGFKSFYEEKIHPVTGEALNQLLQALEDICKSIKAAIPDTEGVDEQLGTANNQ
jgi:uncharacterized protein YukE